MAWQAAIPYIIQIVSALLSSKGGGGGKGGANPSYPPINIPSGRRTQVREPDLSGFSKPMTIADIYRQNISGRGW